MVTVIRPMLVGDVADAEVAWADAFDTMRAAYGLPVDARSAESIERSCSRIAHLLDTDPGGAFVAEDGDGRVIGIAQALVREDCLVLSLLGVATHHQERGTGAALLTAALDYGSAARMGIILCSRDPRAMRRYARAGFDLHPSVTARGRVNRSALASSSRVRPGGSGDLELVATLDRRARGGPHGPDLQHALDAGCSLLVVDGDGYVVARGAKPVLLAAATEQAATELLSACLARATGDEVVEVNWITAAQQWAISVVLDAGLALHPVGPVMTRGMPAPPSWYLPSGAFG